jgi:phosphate starvation-inducible protein PhoH
MCAERTLYPYVDRERFLMLCGKQKDAVKLLEQGYDIEIISEDDFLKNINLPKKQDDNSANMDREQKEYNELINSQKKTTDDLEKEEHLLKMHSNQNPSTTCRNFQQVQIEEKRNVEQDPCVNSMFI